MSIKELRKAIDALDLEEQDPYLILGYAQAGKTLAGTYPITEDMATELRDIAQQALDRIDELDMSEYDGPTQIERGEEGLWVPAEHLNHESVIFGLLDETDELPEIAAADLEGHSFRYYAIGFGSTSGDRTFFVKKNAQHLHGHTKIFALLRGALRPLTSSIISLERGVDFIVRDEGAVVFDTSAFEKYVQDPADVAAEFAESLETLTAQLPFDDETITMLQAVGTKGTILRRRMRSLIERDYFKQLTIARLETEFKHLGRNPRKYVQKGKLKFDPDDAQFVIKVLDESTWLGGFTKTLYSTNGKRREA